MEAIACRRRGRLIPSGADKRSHYSAAFQPAHGRALTRGVLLGLLLGLPLLALLAARALLLLRPC